MNLTDSRAAVVAGVCLMMHLTACAAVTNSPTPSDVGLPKQCSLRMNMSLKSNTGVVVANPDAFFADLFYRLGSAEEQAFRRTALAYSRLVAADASRVKSADDAVALYLGLFQSELEQLQNGGDADCFVAVGAWSDFIGATYSFVRRSPLLDEAFARSKTNWDVLTPLSWVVLLSERYGMRLPTEKRICEAVREAPSLTIAMCD